MWYQQLSLYGLVAAASCSRPPHFACLPVQIMMYFVGLFQQHNAAATATPEQHAAREDTFVHAIRLLIMPLLERSFEKGQRDWLDQELLSVVMKDMFDPPDEVAGRSSLICGEWLDRMSPSDFFRDSITSHAARQSGRWVALALREVAGPSAPKQFIPRDRVTPHPPG